MLKVIHVWTQVQMLMIKTKCKNIFAKRCTSNCFEEVSVIKEVKNTIPWTYVFNDLNGEEIIATFYEKKITKDQPTRIWDRKSNQEKG